MRVVVAYASKYGGTREIAERIANVFRGAGLPAQARSVLLLANVESYGAIILGSAVYMGRWQADASDFVRRNKAALSERPLWLFSSGPLGTERLAADGREVVAQAEPAEIAGYRESLRPRDHKVFFGALKHDALTLPHRVIAALPVGRGLLPDGDFRDWSAIEAWAREIAAELVPLNVPAFAEV